MLLGVVDRTGTGSQLARQLARAAGYPEVPSLHSPLSTWIGPHEAMFVSPRRMATVDDALQEVPIAGRQIVVAIQGKIYNAAELRAGLRRSFDFDTELPGELLAALYQAGGPSALEKINGRFSFALWDARGGELILGRDHLGIEPLFYQDAGGRLVFSTSLRALAATAWVDAALNPRAVLQYLLFCYNPDDETFLRGVYKLPAGHILSVRGSERSLESYWDPSFAERERLSEPEYRERILELFTDAVRVRVDGTLPGVFLSGGTDSSAIVSLVSGLIDEPVRTYSFRCPGRACDESRYARLVADRFKTTHTEITYEARSAESMPDLVAWMEEPFCDNGIELGTFLLARAASGEVEYVLSGEGGDEAFAGHPAYVADRVAGVIDRFPDLIVTPLARVLSRVSDSDQKRDLRVKLRRFARGLLLPRDLLSHRWRLYYTRQELEQLCTADFLASCGVEDRYDAMLRISQRGDGGDRLSRSLYSDYHTLVDFYLRRLGLLGGFAIESRVPLLDRRLVEFAAGIPSRLKLTRGAGSKHIYRKSLEDTVPREVLYDRPKLGHSVPMKRWMREDPWLVAWMRGILFDGRLSAEGFFDSSHVERMLTAHRNKQEDHSHRLWALTVFALWLDSLQTGNP